MSENLNIDELLNSYIDGELSTRQQTEVQRLIAHDPNIAKRLNELQKCKMLLGSLPRVEAPAHLAGQIRASLERKALLSPHVVDIDRRAGRNDLFARKLLTAAAMIGLVAVLAGVIINIVSVRPGAEKDLASDEWNTAPPQIRFEKPKTSLVADAEKTITGTDVLPVTDIMTDFKGTLELRTSDIVAIDAFIKRVIEDNSIFTYATPAGRGKENVYILSCSRRILSSIMTDLENVWHKFDSSALSIETASDFERLVVEAVKPRQISEIAGAPTYLSRMKQNPAMCT
jgi:hypothetical protein